MGDPTLIPVRSVGLLGLPGSLEADVRAALDGRGWTVAEMDHRKEEGSFDAAILVIDPPRLPVGRLRYLQESRPGLPVVGLLKTGFEGMAETVDPEKPIHLVAAVPALDKIALRATLQKLVGKDISGLGPYFPGETPMVEIAAEPAARKHSWLQPARSFLDRSEASSRLTEDCLEVAEEMLMNAFQAAPPGAGILMRTRGAVASRAVLRLAYDGQRAGVSVSDPFGSLRPDTVIRSIARCSRKGPDQIEQKPVGAGLGIYMIYNSSSTMSVSIAPGRRTEVTALIPSRPGSYSVRSFGIFVDGEGAPA
jgi:hypothetical protein